MNLHTLTHMRFNVSSARRPPNDLRLRRVVLRRSYELSAGVSFLTHPLYQPSWIIIICSYFPLHESYTVFSRNLRLNVDNQDVSLHIFLIRTPPAD